MNIAFISSMKGSPWGGSEELWAAAAMAALEEGHRVAVSVFDWRPEPARVVALRAAGAVVLARPLKRSRVLDLLGWTPWLRSLEELGPDVICLSQGGAYEAAGRRSIVPLFPWLARRRTALVNVLQFNEPGVVLRARVRERACWLYERAAANLFVARRNITEANEALGVGWGGVPRARVVCNPVNLVDRAALEWPGDFGAAGGEARFACVARLQARTKGHDVLFEALASDEWKKRAWSLSLFGEGPDRAAYEQQIARLGLGSRVSFRGQISDIRAVWREHHALLMPSRSEGTPLAMVEAMLLGRPCMVTDVGGCADWVQEGTSGVVAAGGELSQVRAAMERLWGLRDAWPRMGKAARERAEGLADPRPGVTLLRVLEDAGRKG